MKESGNGIRTPLGSNSMKTVLLCTLVGFLFVMVCDFIIHGYLLDSTYDLTPNLWRPEAEMQQHIIFMLLMFALIVYAAADIYVRFSEEGGVGEGLRFGLLLGLLFGAIEAMSYCWLPISSTLAFYWFLAGFVRGTGLGIVFSLVNRK